MPRAYIHALPFLRRWILWMATRFTGAFSTSATFRPSVWLYNVNLYERLCIRLGEISCEQDAELGACGRDKKLHVSRRTLEILRTVEILSQQPRLQMVRCSVLNEGINLLLESEKEVINKRCNRNILVTINRALPSFLQLLCRLKCPDITYPVFAPLPYRYHGRSSRSLRSEREQLEAILSPTRSVRGLL